jgi:hypothetical protein
MGQLHIPTPRTEFSVSSSVTGRSELTGEHMGWLLQCQIMQKIHFCCCAPRKLCLCTYEMTESQVHVLAAFVSPLVGHWNASLCHTVGSSRYYRVRDWPRELMLLRFFV